MKTSNGLLFDLDGNGQPYICIEGLPEPWPYSKLVYLKMEEAAELKELLEATLKKPNKIIFDTNV